MPDEWRTLLLVEPYAWEQREFASYHGEVDVPGKQFHDRRASLDRQVLPHLLGVAAANQSQSARLV